ncbi:MAG: D-alanyl-D-alanine carboxypeptidase family protein [Prochlorococcaceae cyanobacterium]
MAPVSDDIPEARRSAPATLRRSPRRSRLIGAGLIGLLALTTAALLSPAGRRLLAPPPVAGLAARPGLDGRLLGHFPYSEAAAEDLVAFAPGQQLHRDAAPALRQMQQAARADGIDLVVLSAFRSQAAQNGLFFDVKSERNQSARERAHVSAPPGYSEHSTGYALDLGDGSLPASHLSAGFEATPAFAWLQRNAARFHFQLSFPPGNGQGVSYEPWHWRFEGTADALRIFEPAHRLAR